METKTQFTVFFRVGFLVSGDCGAYSLEDLMSHDSDGQDRPIAWAADVPYVWGGQLGADDLLAESLAAGRTIELIDGKYVARGVEEPKPAQALGDLLRKAGQGLPSKTPTLDKLEAEHAGNAAMIARDGPAKQTFIRFTCVDCTGCAKCAPVSTAKPALSFLTLSPDLQPSSHLVAPAHGSALLRG